MAKNSIVEQLQKYRKALLVESVQPSANSIKQAVNKAQMDGRSLVKSDVISPLYGKLISFVANKMGKIFMSNPDELANLLATDIANGGGQLFVDFIDSHLGATIDAVSEKDDEIGDAGSMYDIVVNAFYTAHGKEGGFSF